MSIGLNLKLLRTEKGLSQREMAEKLDINFRTYASYERNEREPSSATILKICNAFGVSSDELLKDNNSSTHRETEITHSASDDELKFALFDGSEGVTDEMFEEVKQFAAMVKMRENAKKEIK